ncbi:hypothetical protein [Streptosporangium sp. NPDC023615]|uniref:hypothetical protein n=1 Tax=Streptosporangium sp. NPDC023615 TaxID=3154794 RepID=UPI003423D9F3
MITSGEVVTSVRGEDLLDRVERLRHVLLTLTSRGTTLSVPLERAEVDGDRVRLWGTFTLDRVPVRCVADLSLRTGAGILTGEAA